MRYSKQNLLVVNKPPSYLIYPASGHRHNSLLFVLRRELGPERAGDLRPLHRLDKYTSGVLCFAKVLNKKGVFFTHLSTLSFMLYIREPQVP